MPMQRIPSDAEWTHGRVATLPKRWSDRPLRQWQASQATDYCKANVDLRETTEALLRVPIPLDVSDVDICEAADALAARCAGRAEVFHTTDALRAAMERICQGQGIQHPSPQLRA